MELFLEKVQGISWLRQVWDFCLLDGPSLQIMKIEPVHDVLWVMEVSSMVFCVAELHSQLSLNN